MIADLGERAKSSWATPESEPPVPHAELLTLERLVATTALPVPLAEGLARLRAYGIEASEVSPMWSLAEAHGRRAHDLVRILAGA